MVASKSKRIQLTGNKKPQLERNDSLNLFYSDVRQHKQLSNEETKALFKLYHKGTKEEREFAFNKICNHNMRIVISLAREYCSNEDNLNDLIQEGNIGLMKAVEMFDEENGTPFHGYSIYWIRRYINIFKTNITPIVAQTNRSKTASTITTITNELWQKLERIPTPDEILDEYNKRYPKKSINDTDDLVNVEYVYIDQLEPLTDTNQDLQAYIDYNAASVSHNEYMDDVESEYNKKLLSTLLNSLTENEIKVVRMMYGLDGGLESSISSISSKLGVTNQRVWQLYKKALNKMRKKREELSYHYI